MADSSPDAPAPRRALIDAAKALLAQRVPSTVTGRELAAAASVNYGLIHHYFGGKEAVFREAFFELRDEFLAAHPAHDLPELLIEPQHPFLRAIGRTQIDYPDEVGEGDDFPIGHAMVAAVRARLPDGPGRDAEAKARVVAMMSMQLAYGLYQRMLLDTALVGEDERAAVEDALRLLYAEVAVSAPGNGRETSAS